MAHSYGLRLCCVPPAKDWITLLCRTDGCFSLPFPIVFDVLRENKDESRRKTVFLLQILSEMPRLILRC